MSARKLFGDHPVGAITMIDTPVSLSYARKARVTFLAVAAGVATATAIVLSVFQHPVLAVMIGIAAGLVCGFVAAALVRVWPVLRVLWWWLTEVVLAALMVLTPSLAARQAGPVVALFLLGVLLAVGAGVASVRRRLAAWSWCVVVRHRLRLCFAEFVRAVSRLHAGRLPLILWARPTLAGERVWVWLRPGLDLADLEGKAGRIAVACWAKQVRVLAASERYAALIRVDVARRDPLSGRVDSPLSLLIPALRNNKKVNVPVFAAVPPVGLDLADIEEPAPEPRGGRR